MDGLGCDFDGIGDGVCEAGKCVAAPECVSPGDCDDGNVCTDQDCILGACIYTPNDGAVCDVGGLPGLCKAGDCIGLCDDQDCTSTSQCVQDGTCDDQSGDCVPGDNQPADTDCTENGGSVCDGSGNCVECNDDAQCSGGEVCTDNVCMSGSVDYPEQTAIIDVACSNNVTSNISILPFALAIDPGPMAAGGAFTADISAAGEFSEAFLDIAQIVIPCGVDTGQVLGIAATVALRTSGATGADVQLGADLNALDDRCQLTGDLCDSSTNNADGSNAGCIPVGTFNQCFRGFADVPTLNGSPNTAGGCDPGTPPVCVSPPDTVPDCDCSACETLDTPGCIPGNTNVPCTKGDQCRKNGFCVTGGLPIPLTSDVGNYTAGTSGQDILWGWYDGNPVATNANGSSVIPPAASSIDPLGMNVSAGGLVVNLRCVMSVDSGGVDGVSTCEDGPNVNTAEQFLTQIVECPQVINAPVKFDLYQSIGLMRVFR
jgi:hypothetical protein